MTVDVETAATRSKRILSGVVQPLRVPLLAYSGGVFVALIAAAVAAWTTADPWLAALTGAAVAGAFGAVLLAQLRNPDRRAAWALFEEHRLFEESEWKQRYGGRAPRSWPELKSMAERHEDPAQRAALLVQVGRLAEGDALLAGLSPGTMDEWFGLEHTRQVSALLAGRETDRSALVARLSTIDDMVERRHRRQCLAFWDAMVAVDRGADPVAPLAEGWRAGEPAPEKMQPANRAQRYVFWMIAGPGLIGFFSGLLASAVAGG